ncbi:trypsin-like peptidase domain-containing protein [Candidatus Dojkabacteria bacterium]|uniref:Trypsin-like peptidase domain-containing protein n=1 Tax=Candidatus Dojkabacteria bacterium TaxID=2099670 RepID=A0A955RI68_9BACT|nr:trypsin-like peptidase domain-containing protein [Candidatus Dojkabacteria bacterium]
MENQTKQNPVEKVEPAMAQPSNTVNSNSNLTATSGKKKKSGCMKWGCLGGIILLIIFACSATGFGMWYGGYIQSWSCKLVTQGSPAYDTLKCINYNDDSSNGINSNSNNNNTEGNATNPANSDDIVSLVNETKDAVVSISITSERFDFQTGQGSVVSDDIGTGFIIESDGLIVTNQHVVSDQSAEYSVYVPGKTDPYKAVSILRDESDDIAFIKIEATGLPTLKLGNSDKLALGESVIAIGNPLGNRGTVTSGIISGLDRSVQVSQGGNSGFNYRGALQEFEGVIQTDAAINPGNSGGPLIDMNAEVVGINFATSSGVNNISFALPINRIKPRIDEYKTTGKFSKPYLGVSYQPISQIEAQFYDNVVPGALVQSVVAGSPAEKAGVQKFDIITEIDGKDASSSLSTMVQGYEVGDTVTLTVYRDGKTMKIKVKLEEGS